MTLITDEQLNLLPKFYDTEKLSNKETKVPLKFFVPIIGFRWYAVEYCPNDRIFFGFANLNDDQCAELGYFSLDELESLSSPRVQIDSSWNPNTTLEEVISFKKR